MAVLHSLHSGVDGQLCMALCLQMQDSGTIFLRCGGKIHKGLLMLPLLCLHHIGRKHSKGHIRCCSRTGGHIADLLFSHGLAAGKNRRKRR